MHSFFGGVITDQLRWHPWTESHDNPEFKYVNFVENAEEIPNVLEDFKQYDSYEGVREFYKLLKWMNGPESPYETSDSRLVLKENDQKEECNKQLVAHGSLMFMLRDAIKNLSADSRRGAHIENNEVKSIYFTPSEELRYLTDTFVRLFQGIEKDFKFGAIEVRLFPTYYSKAPVPEIDKNGYQFVFRFWAWGDTEQEVFDKFSLLNDIMYSVLHHVANYLSKIFPETVDNSQNSNK